MNAIFPGITLARLLEINPKAAQVLFRYGVRSFFAPGIADETLEQLSHAHDFNLAAVIEDLNTLITVGSDFLKRL